MKKSLILVLMFLFVSVFLYAGDKDGNEKSESAPPIPPLPPITSSAQEKL